MNTKVIPVTWYSKMLAFFVIVCSFFRAGIKDQPMKGWEIWAIMGLWCIIHIGEELTKIRRSLEDSNKE